MALINPLAGVISNPVEGQPQQYVGPTNAPTTSSQLPPQAVPTQLPALTLPQITLESQPYNLRGINGQQFVAANTGVPQLSGASTTINNLAGQLGSGGPSTSGTQMALDMANTLNYKPTGNPLDAILDINNQLAIPSRTDATTLALDAMGKITSTDNPYLRSAYRRGTEMAASRGLMNSSIAAGTAQREAIDASMPIFNQTMDLLGQREQQDFSALMASREAGYQVASQRENQLFQQARDTFNAASQLEGQDRQNAFARAQQMLDAATSLQSQRENQAFQSQENQLSRTQAVNNALLGSELDYNQQILGASLGSQARIEEAQIQAQLQERDALLRRNLTQDTTLQQDWLADRNFTRQFNANLSMLPISSSMDMYSALTKYALEEPEVYTPEVISGFANFFRNDMNAMLSQYLGGNS